MRKMSMSSAEKERAMVLVEWHVLASVNNGVRGWALGIGHRGNIRLRSAAIGLPVAVKLLVRHCGGYGE